MSVVVLGTNSITIDGKIIETFKSDGTGFSDIDIEITTSDSIDNIVRKYPPIAPIGLPGNTDADQQNNRHLWNISEVYDSNGYSTFMNSTTTYDTYLNNDTRVGLSQIISGKEYQFRTNYSGFSNGKFYDLFDNDHNSNWYVYPGTVFANDGAYVITQPCFNNHDVTYLDNGTNIRGIWVELGIEIPIILTRYGIAFADSENDRNIRSLEEWTIVGSNDRLIWTIIHNVPVDISSPDVVHNVPPHMTEIFYQTFPQPLPYKYIRKILRKIDINTWYAQTTFNIYGIEVIPAPPLVKPQQVEKEYKYITFPNIRTEQTEYSINFTEDTECDILVVGGGGGGGRRHGGGGGAGTLLYHKTQILNGTYNIKVGKGGNGAINNSGSGGVGIFSEFIKDNGTKRYYANGGGGGSSGSHQTTTNGGQGMTINSSLTLPINNIFDNVTVSVVSNQYQNSLTLPEGCRGFIGGLQVENYKSGGGGGSGSVGQSHGLESTINDGYGGDGLSIDITGVNVIYAGGGNGSSWADTVSPVRDPNKLTIESRGGGGFGSDNNLPENGKNGTGGGGGGQGNDILIAGNGGSGIVIIRYKLKSTNFNAQWTYNSLNTNVYHLGNVGIGKINPVKELDVVGSISASIGISALSKTFKIEHPLNINKLLYHGCVECPRFDNIYRGKKLLKNGTCCVDIDRECNTTGGMIEGTFASLNTNFSLYLRNNQTFDCVKGIINDGKITINCQNTKDEIEIVWIVIGERIDRTIVNVPLTNLNGNLICEHDIN